MPSGVFKVKNIPKDKVERVVNLYKRDWPKPKSIDEIDQGGGLWTVVATFPDGGETTEEEYSEEKYG